MAEPKMVSMKRSAEDKRGDKMESAPMEATAPDYPYGLCIHLDRDELDKLGIKGLPAIGTTMAMTGMVKVTRVSSSATGDDEYTSVDLQITDMGVA
jgi:hypothetical protein